LLHHILLHHMGQLVSKQPSPHFRSRRVLSSVEDDVMSYRVRKRISRNPSLSMINETPTPWKLV